MGAITTLRLDVLAKYANNRVFVETGTYLGGGLEVALDCGFRRIITIEVHEPYHETQKQRLAGRGIEFVLGDSGTKLEEVIRNIDEPITFWLDGHAHVDGHGEKKTPILEELAAIARHPVKKHTILVDDRRVMGTDEWGGVSEEQVVAAIREINPNYCFGYENATVTDDILVAHLHHRAHSRI